MGRRGNRRSQRKKPRTSNSRRRRSVAPARLPPARGLMANIFRSVVQTAWDIAQGALGVGESDHPTNVKVDADNGYLLAQGWRDRYAGLFREIKVHKVEAWYMPYAQSTDPGLYTFTICDYGENAISDSALGAIGVPGTVCRRMNQTAYRCWYPTEPSDREWQLLSDGHRWLTYVIRSAESRYWVHGDRNTEVQHQASLAGKVIINTHASFRGKGDGKITYNSTCGCVKCTRIEAYKSRTLINEFEQITVPERDSQMVSLRES